MNLYISDLHFGHENVIRFDHRPFADVEEMDRCLIQLWNSRVSAEDEVYILGDFCYRSSRSPDWYLRQLKGHKHLIVGNHDKATLACENAARYLESIDKMLHVTDGGKEICLCHYPIADWYKGRHGSWHIYGHIHASRDDVFLLMKTRERALNAGACINNYTPASVNELIRNNKAFQKATEEEELLFVARNQATGEQVLFSFTDLVAGNMSETGLSLKNGWVLTTQERPSEGLEGTVTRNPDIGIRLAREEDRNDIRNLG